MGSGGVPYRTPTLNQACLARGPRPGPSPTPTPPTVPARPLDFSADSGEREFPPLLVLLVMSLLFCLQTPHHQRNFTFQRLLPLFLQLYPVVASRWARDPLVGPGRQPLSPSSLCRPTPEAHLGSPSPLPGCLSFPAPPNSSWLIASTSTPLPSAKVPMTTAANGYGVLRGPHQSSHEPLQPPQQELLVLLYR